MRAVLKAMYQYAKLNEYIDRDLTEGLVYEWTNSTEQILDERDNFIVQWDNSVFPGFGFHYTYGTYMNGNFNMCMGKLKMKHLPPRWQTHLCFTHGQCRSK